MAAFTDEGRVARRIGAVEEHVRRENARDLDAIMGTFGQSASYDDRSSAEHHVGHAAVRSFYAQLLTAIPDLYIEVEHRHVTDDNVVLEVVITGTHLGPWRGLPGTGRPVELPLCAIFDFDAEDRLAGERIYYDRATLLRQMGVAHEPTSFMGRVAMVLFHPVTVARAVAGRN